MPSPASLSRFGVRTSLFPAQPMDQYPMSSAITMTIFGLSAILLSSLRYSLASILPYSRHKVNSKLFLQAVSIPNHLLFILITINRKTKKQQKNVMEHTFSADLPQFQTETPETESPQKLPPDTPAHGNAPSPGNRQLTRDRIMERNTIDRIRKACLNG